MRFSIAHTISDRFSLGYNLGVQWDGGFTYLIMPNLQLDISAGIGINDETIDNFISFGLSYRLPE